jgi:hypothetical protein
MLRDPIDTRAISLFEVDCDREGEEGHGRPLEIFVATSITAKPIPRGRDGRILVHRAKSRKTEHGLWQHLIDPRAMDLSDGKCDRERRSGICTD